MAISPEELADLAALTLQEPHKGQFVEIASDLQDHVAFNHLWRREQTQFRSGDVLNWSVMVKHSEAARRVDLLDVDNVNIVDMHATAQVEWRFLETSWAADRRVISLNRSPAQIVDYLRQQRNGAMISLADLFETDAWNKPVDSTDKKQIYGFLYWLVYNATEGFNGGNPSGYTSGAGALNSSTYSRWANWTNQYTNVTKSDLVRKWRKAMTFTRSMSPMGTQVNSPGGPDRYGCYTNYNVIGPLEEALEQQNDNLGPDIASMDGRLTFRRNPVVWVPQLENVTGDPVLGINWGTFKFVCNSGRFLHETRRPMGSQQHNMMEAFIDTTCNLVCYNRRKNFLLATADPVA